MDIINHIINYMTIGSYLVTLIHAILVGNGLVCEQITLYDTLFKGDFETIFCLISWEQYENVLAKTYWPKTYCKNILKQNIL